MACNDPQIIKMTYGRAIKNFNEETWSLHKIDIVTHGNYLKFTQNEKLLKQMLKYKDHVIVEASPYDKIWGIGLHFDDDRVLDESKWEGENLLGVCIMNARDQIVQEGYRVTGLTL
jgi:ribA/ribD-fused uncharacterized protein